MNRQLMLLFREHSANDSRLLPPLEHAQAVRLVSFLLCTVFERAGGVFHISATTAQQKCEYSTQVVIVTCDSCGVSCARNSSQV